MDIRLLSLIPVQKQSGPEMDTAETVTFFNDMCCLAPATLIDPRITWNEIDHHRVEGIFTTSGITISAILEFNAAGYLINFISDDRYAAEKDGSMTRRRWSTPLHHYRVFNGHHIAGKADAVYQYPEGDFCYGKFSTVSVTYNPTSLP